MYFEGTHALKRALVELGLLAPGQDVLLEVRYRPSTVTRSVQTLFECVWDLAAFEHVGKTRSMGFLQHVLLPWYLCVEYEPHKYALYRVDDGTTGSVSNRRNRWGNTKQQP